MRASISIAIAGLIIEAALIGSATAQSNVRGVSPAFLGCKAFAEDQATIGIAVIQTWAD